MFRLYTVRWDSISQNRTLYESFVVNSRKTLVFSASFIASYFGVSESEVGKGRFVCLAYNGDFSASQQPVEGHIGSEGATVFTPGSGTMRVDVTVVRLY